MRIYLMSELQKDGYLLIPYVFLTKKEAEQYMHTYCSSHRGIHIVMKYRIHEVISPATFDYELKPDAPAEDRGD